MDPNIRPSKPNSTPVGTETVVRAQSAILVDSKDDRPINEPFSKVETQLRGKPVIRAISYDGTEGASTITLDALCEFGAGDIIISSNLVGGSATVVSFAAGVLTLDREVIATVSNEPATLERRNLTALGPQAAFTLAVTTADTNDTLTMAASTDAAVLAARARIVYGMPVSGAGIPAGTVVTGYNPVTREIELSEEATASAAITLTCWTGVSKSFIEVLVVDSAETYLPPSGLAILVDDADVTSPIKIAYNGNVYALALA